VSFGAVNYTPKALLGVSRWYGQGRQVHSWGCVGDVGMGRGAHGGMGRGAHGGVYGGVQRSFLRAFFTACFLCDQDSVTPF